MAVICGLGGCRIASRPGACQAGKASPRSPQSGSSLGTISPLAFLDLLAERLALRGQVADPGGHLADLLVGSQGQFFAIDVTDWGRFRPSAAA